MAGFQFLHVESYSRKADAKGCSTEFVFDEASRRPGACEHVENPGQPVTVFGKSVDEIRGLHDELVDAARCVTKAGKSRKVRVDQHTLLTVIASHPAAPGDHVDAVQAWQDRTVRWLRDQWGDRLQSVIRHDDEGHVHVHAYVLPDDVELRARALHPGVQAKERAKSAALDEGYDAKAANKIGDDAYKAAMRRMQDSFFESVGVASGLARLGPGRRRLTRDQWRAEQAQVEHAATVVSISEQSVTVRIEAERYARDLGKRGRDFVARARAAASIAQEAASQAQAAERRARGAVARLVDGFKDVFARIASLESRLQVSETALSSERAARRRAEDQREDFRGRWADADNKLSALVHGRRS